MRKNPVVPPPANPLADNNPADIAHNVRSVLTFLSWVDIEREAMPHGSQFGHALILETLIGALDHLENLLEAQRTGKAGSHCGSEMAPSREVTP
ncbi:MAG: hypothetical protein RKO66_14275 [Candidatus Contendobacter sp.]|nr:hypothetical protein [Candidatus Contendobacter sp.]